MHYTILYFCDHAIFSDDSALGIDVVSKEDSLLNPPMLSKTRYTRSQAYSGRRRLVSLRA